MNSGAQVYVQVVPIEAGREIGWGSNLVQQLEERRESIKEAIVAGSSTIAESLAQLRPPTSWEIKEVGASFGITLTAEAGVILSKASAEATFEVTVTFARADAAPESPASP
jgi:Trypsin-co-occurring domain 1